MVRPRLRLGRKLTGSVLPLTFSRGVCPHLYRKAMSIQSYRFAVTLILLAPVSGAAQTTIDEASTRDLTQLTSGIVMGLYHNGAIDFLSSWGTASHDETEPLTPDGLFPFPGFTEILIATTTRALSVAGVVDDNAPIARYLPDLPTELGAITLDQLLTHSAGLDDAPPLEGQTWSEALDRLSGRALMTEPGLIFSESRYSYPLAGRVIERATNASLTELITTAILRPFGMERSTFSLEEARLLGVPQGYAGNANPSDPVVEVELAAEVEGLSVLYTTVEDVIRLVAALLDGTIEAGMPLDRGDSFHNPIPGSRFVDGFQIHEYRGVPRAYRSSAGLGFGASIRVLPESRTVLVAWGNGSYPVRTSRFIENAIATSLDLPAAVPMAPNPLPEELEALRDPAAWAGTYRNGNLIIVLRYEQENLQLFSGTQNLSVAPIREGVMAARIADGRIALIFQLVEVDGRRYVFLHGPRSIAYSMQPP